MTLPASAQVTISNITTEYATNPAALDVSQPRFGWRLMGSKRAQFQRAYQLLVASSPSRIKANKGDSLDSGRVLSDRTLEIMYQGQPLASGRTYYWKVRVWDNSDHASPWSATGSFGMGLLHQADWQGKWIGWAAPPKSVTPVSLQGTRWIWYPGENAHVSAPAGSRYFRKTFDLAPATPIRQALFAGTADDNFALYVNGAEAGHITTWEHPQVFDITSFMQPGANSLAVRATNGALSPAGFSGRLQITFANHEPLTISTDKTWRVSQQAPDNWRATSFVDTGWQQAEEITNYGDAPWGALPLPAYKPSAPIPAPLLRKEFTVFKAVASAQLYVCGLGLYDLHLNGQRVDDTVLNPAHTQYDKRVLYTKYDVTKLLQRGGNCLAVELGRGFFAMREATPWAWDEAAWNSPPKLLCQLNMRFTDGTQSSVVSDGSWQLCGAGPTRSDAIYGGETYDARLEKTGWQQPGYNNAGFVAASVVPPPKGQLRSQVLPPMRVVETRRPISTSSPKPHWYVFDVGPVTTGWIKLTASCPAGTKIQINYSERLNSDGTTREFGENDSDGPAQTDTYIFKGQGNETWEPKFSYKGFQYVEVKDCPVPLTAQNVTIQVIHSDVATIGNFACSNPFFNTLQQNTVRTLLNNLHGKPTDTPVYEKNGWMGDGNIIAETALYNLDMTQFYEKWVDDMSDSMNDRGLVPLIAPTDTWGMAHSPEWNSAYIFIPWHLYQYNGDKELLRRQYTGLTKYIAYEKSELKQGLSNSVLSDWAAPGTDDMGAVKGHGAQAPEGGTLTGTAYAYRALQLMAAISDLLGKPANQDDQAAADTIAKAFNANFLDAANNVYHTEQPVGYRQTSSILPLAFDLVPAANQAEVMANLVADIHRKDNHLDTGFLGTKYILPVLTESGHGDVAYAIANQRTYPSWGYWVAQGATTMWEIWEPSTRSKDHYFFGTVDEWFYKYLAGIRAGTDGFKTIIIKPYALGDLTYARASVNTVRGLVAAGWQRSDPHHLQLNVTIPVGATATIYVPAGNAAAVTESGLPAARAQAVHFLRQEKDYAVYQVASGTYHFTSLLP